MAQKKSKKRYGSNNKFKGNAKKRKFEDKSSTDKQDSDQVLTETNSEQSQNPSTSETPISTASSKKLSKVVSKSKKQSKRRKSLQNRLEVPTGNRLIDMNQLSKALLQVHVCPEGELLLREDPLNRQGLSSTLYICCSSCKAGEPLKTSPPASTGNLLDVNRRSAYASIEVGVGRQGLADLCALLNMPPPVSGAAFSNHIMKVRDISNKVSEENMSAAAEELRSLMMAEDSSLTEDDDIEVCVSYDGTWSKRGFTANHGIGIIISMDTGKVLDRVSLSKVCGPCMKKNRADKSSETYKNWYEKHKPVCQQNYTGTSPGMETHAAKLLFERSRTKHKLIYKWMVCDGDSKAHSDVKDVYGDEHTVVKLDCVGHVGKRMYKNLENTKRKHKGKLADGKPIGGKGRLTSGPNGIISRISELYRNAIRQNVSDISLSDKDKVNACVDKMKTSILAILYHEVKLEDDNLRHKFCPESTTDNISWCEFKKSGTMEDKPHHLDPVFMDILSPVFARLSDPVLLERCIKGYTQNQNESFNALIWKRCPKYLWRGPCQIQVAVNLAVLQWNSGSYEGRKNVLVELGLDFGEHVSKASSKKDEKRVATSIHRASEKEKNLRHTLTKKKLLQEAEKKRREGKTYGSALFAGLTNADFSDSDDDVPLSTMVCERYDSSDDDEPLAHLMPLSHTK